MAAGMTRMWYVKRWLSVAVPICCPDRMKVATHWPTKGTRPACSAATTVDHTPSWSQRSTCPVKPMATVSPSRRTPEIQFSSRGNLYDPVMNTRMAWSPSSTIIAEAPK